MSTPSVCAGCEQKIHPSETVAYVVGLQRAPEEGHKAPRAKPALYHEAHVPGFSRSLWDGKLADWPGPRAKY